MVGWSLNQGKEWVLVDGYFTTTNSQKVSQSRHILAKFLQFQPGRGKNYGHRLNSTTVLRCRKIINPFVLSRGWGRKITTNLTTFLVCFFLREDVEKLRPTSEFNHFSYFLLMWGSKQARASRILLHTTIAFFSR